MPNPKIELRHEQEKRARKISDQIKALREKTEREKRDRSIKLSKIVKQSILERANIQKELASDSIDITLSSFPNHAISSGATVPLKDPVSERIYHVDFLGDMFRGTGVSGLTGSWPFKQLKHLPISLKFLLDFQGHGTEPIFQRGRAIGAIKNEELFLSNLHIRGLSELMLHQFSANMFNYPGDDPIHLMKEMSRIIDEEINNVSKKGGVMFGQGTMSASRRLPSFPGAELHPEHNFVELTYIPWGSEFYLVQGDKIQKMEANNEFKLNNASKLFADCYDTPELTNKIPENLLAGLMSSMADGNVNVGRHVFEGGENQSPLMFISFSDGVDEQKNHKGLRLNETIDLQKHLLGLCQTRHFDAIDVANDIYKTVEQHRGPDTPRGDDTTIYVERLV